MKGKLATAALLLTVTGIFVSLRIYARLNSPSPAPLPRTFAAGMPATVLWAWEEPEDLSTLDSARIGVAYLAETLTLSDRVTRRPRFQPLRTAPEASVMAVVRIQPIAGFEDSPALRAATAEALAKVAAKPNLRAFQIDFDATESQREFYAAVLKQLRPVMPRGMPLSITALVSWCGSETWLSGLPIDEAVPMHFRLGGAAGPTADKSAYQILQPVCRTSTGVSTDETWPTISPTLRLYLFAPHPWTAAQIATLNTTPNIRLEQEFHP